MQKETTQIPNKPFRFLIHSSKTHMYWAFGAIAAVTVAQILSSSLPFFFKNIIDTATGPVADFSATQFWVIALIVAISFMYTAWRTSGFLGIQWITGASATGYSSLFEHLSLHSPTYFSNRFAGSVTNKVSHASDGAERLADHLLWNYYTSVIQLCITGGLIYVTSILVGYIYIVLVAVLFFVNYIMVQMRRPLVIRHANEDSTLRGQAVDVTSNINAVWQFAHRPFELHLLGKQITARRDADLAHSRHSEIGLVVNSILITVAVGYMFVFSFNQLSAGAITIGDFVMVVTLMFSMMGTLTHIGGMMNGFIRTYSEIEEGLEEILIPHEIVDEGDAKKLTVTKGEIIFDSVHFAYNNDPIFSKLDLTIPAKQKIGVVGASGAGKTTLVGLLLRQQDISDGSIRIDGQDIARVTQDSLRHAIGIIPQEPLLFHRSIRENIRYGKLDASNEEIERAADLAQAHEFILETPEAYDTYVGERGIKLSGGQRQRIAIARAILKNAPVLVLDEATSALDSESEVYIQKALQELVKDKTVIAIAHRLSTLREMDRIIVLDRGRIVQDGTHEELLNDHKGVYLRLWNHQAGGFLQEEEES